MDTALALLDFMVHNLSTVLLWVLAAVLAVAIFRGHRKLREERAEYRNARAEWEEYMVDRGLCVTCGAGPGEGHGELVHRYNEEL